MGQWGFPRRRTTLGLGARKEGGEDTEQDWKKLSHAVCCISPTIAHLSLSPPQNCRRRCRELLMAIYFCNFLCLYSVQKIWRIKRSTTSLYTDSKRGSCEVLERDSHEFKLHVCFLHSLNFCESSNLSEPLLPPLGGSLTIPPTSLEMNIGTSSSGNTVDTQ